MIQNAVFSKKQKNHIFLTKKPLNIKNMHISCKMTKTGKNSK